jgi:hypothetical protein
MARDWGTARRAGSLGSSRAEGRTRTLQHAGHVQRRLRIKPLRANPPGGVGAVAGFLLPDLLGGKTTRASSFNRIRRCPEAPFFWTAAADGNPAVLAQRGSVARGRSLRGHEGNVGGFRSKKPPTNPAWSQWRGLSGGSQTWGLDRSSPSHRKLAPRHGWAYSRVCLATRSDRAARFGWSVAFSTHTKAPDGNGGRGFRCIRRKSLARVA